MLQKARVGQLASVAQRCLAGAGYRSPEHHPFHARAGRASRDTHTTTAGAGKTRYTDASGRRVDPLVRCGNQRDPSSAAGKISLGFHTKIERGATP